ncbi:unnamed protein product [Sphagnum troendelagicum]|uniref:ACB domain-containing protein n=1 Tax=Sphagnum troendelagicum TaxID=128251 RepID=A0ABP0U7F9_9BRYO
MAYGGMATALPYPDRFYAGAAYAGLSATSPGNVDSLKSSSLGLSDDTILLLYGLYKQATVGPCNLPKPWSWNVIDLAKWTSWNQLGRMDSMEAMRLFIRTLEEDDPSWWSKAQELDKEVTLDTEEMDNEKLVVEVELNWEINVEDTPTAVVPSESNDLLKVNGIFSTAEVEDVAEGIRAIAVYNEWVSPTVTGRRPSARYQHAAGVVDNKMYIIGGNHIGRYLNDVQVLDLKTLEWSKVDKVPQSPLSLQQKQSPHWFPPCAGHSLVRWGTKLLAVAGHSKEPVDTVIVRAFDTHTMTWTILDVYGKSPIARGGQSVTLVGSTLVMFGGEDSKRHHLMDDLNILDLESLTWEAIETSGTRPSPRADHVAAVHRDRYLFLFGGGSRSNCYNDLYVLDLESMEWSQAQTQGTVPSPHAGHAGATIGNSFYIIGGGDNKSGISDTLVLNMDTLVWSLVASVKGQTAISSEGLSVLAVEDSLVAFGGYNGHFNNQVHVFQTFPSERLQSKILKSPVAAAAAAFAAPQPVLSSPLNGTSSLSPDPEETVSESRAVPESMQENLDGEQLREEPECALDDSATGKKLALVLKVNEELQEATLAAQAECAKLQNELAMAQFNSSELEQELLSVRGQLAAEQSRSFRLEVDVAELREKLQSIEILQKELDLLQHQKAASEEAVIQAAQKQSTGVWSWLAGSPPDSNGVED